ncbi:hypothetical protein JTB14_037356 [Gonioctena quinquepunctata]|nr:hypothetical protein JTB14_037356 [Gonioctena quinquepunctata]
MASTVCSSVDTAGTSIHNLCQKRKCSKHKLSDLTNIDKDNFLKYYGLGKELLDADFDATIVRIEQTLTNSGKKCIYHRGCYSNSKHSGRLETSPRLRLTVWTLKSVFSAKASKTKH